LNFRHERNLSDKFPRYHDRSRAKSSEPSNFLDNRLLESLPFAAAGIFGLALYGATTLGQPLKAGTSCVQPYENDPPQCVYDYLPKKGLSDKERENQAAAFCNKYAPAVEADHPVVKETVSQALKHDGALSADQIFDIYDHLSRILGFQNISKRIYPFAASETLKSLKGDCKNLVVVLASTLISIGGDVRIVIDEGETPDQGHTFLEVKIPEGMNASDVQDKINQRYRLGDRLSFVKRMERSLESLAFVTERSLNKGILRVDSAVKTIDGLKKNKTMGKKARKKSIDQVLKDGNFFVKAISLQLRLKRILGEHKKIAKDLTELFGNDWLMFNGKAVPFTGVSIRRDGDSLWLALDLTTDSYPGSIRKPSFRADFTLELRRSE
jgi:hypothetical protein